MPTHKSLSFEVRPPLSVRLIASGPLGARVLGALQSIDGISLRIARRSGAADPDAARRFGCRRFRRDAPLQCRGRPHCLPRAARRRVPTRQQDRAAARGPQGRPARVRRVRGLHARAANAPPPARASAAPQRAAAAAVRRQRAQDAAHVLAAEHQVAAGGAATRELPAARADALAARAPAPAAQHI